MTSTHRDSTYLSMRRAPSTNDMNTLPSYNHHRPDAPRSAGDRFFNGRNSHHRSSSHHRMLAQRRQKLLRQVIPAMLLGCLLLTGVWKWSRDGSSSDPGDGIMEEDDGDRNLSTGGDEEKTSPNKINSAEDAAVNEFVSSSFGGAVYPGYFRPEDAVVESTASNLPTSFRFAAITDMDNLSKVEDVSKPTFQALLQPGVIHRDETNNKYTITFDEPRELHTTLNEGGRGAEYSELTIFGNRLLTYDDRTGAVVELLNSKDGQSTRPVTRYILTQGNGESTKGMKWEWATVKDDELFIGGIGKEMQLSNGDVDHEDAMWVAVLGKDGQIRREDWSPQYNFVRKYVGCQLPGYMAHEAIEWSPFLRKWIFLPRRVSFHQYVPDLDERLGSNKVIVVDEDFSDAKVIEIDLQHHEAGLRGFSSFAFVPNTQDEHVLALRSVEENCVGDNPACQFKTYICVFELLSGDVLMEELLMDQPVKFEGIEFVNLFAKPPERNVPEKRLRGSTT